MPFHAIAAIALALAFAAAGIPSAAAGLAATTNRPDINTFELGEPVELILEGDVAPLTLEILDEFDRVRSRRELPAAPDAAPRRIPMPAAKLGFYRVRLLGCDGKPAIPALGSRPAGEVTYAVVPPVAGRKLYPIDRTFFGMQGGGPIFAAAIPYLGVRHTVAARFWDQFERNRPGEFKETRERLRAAGKAYPDDTVYGAAARFGQDRKEPWVSYPLPSFLRTPQWKDSPLKAGVRPGRFSALSADGLRLFGEYCYEAAKAYREDHPDFAARYYQVSWEPHYPWGFDGTSEQLVEVYRVAYEAIHRADPKAVVVGPCYAGNGANSIAMLRQAFAAGIGKYLDAVSHHPYSAFPPESADPIGVTREIRAICREYTGKELPLLGTEQGYQTVRLNCELDKARGDVRMALIQLGEGWRCHQTFYIFDYIGEPGYGYYYTLDPKQGWSPRAGSPKAGVPAFAALTDLLEGHRPTARIDFLGEGILGYAYEGDNGNIIALWNYHETPKNISLPVGVPALEQRDWMGNAVRVETDRGSLKLRLTGEPVYLVGVSPRIWGRDAEKLLEIPAAPLAAVPGKKVRVTGTIRNPRPEPIRGVLKIAGVSDFARFPAEIPVAAPPHGGAPFGFDVAIRPDAKPGDYQLALALDDRNGGISLGGVNFKVQPPLVFSDVRPIVESGTPGISYHLAAAEPEPIRCPVSTRIRGVPGARRSQSAVVTGTRGFLGKILFPEAKFDPLRQYRLELSARTPGGYERQIEQSVNFAAIPHLAAPPVFRGRAADWATGAAGFPIQGMAAIREPLTLKVQNPQDLSAVMYAGWTAEALYLAFDVTDDVFHQEFNDWYVWNGDAIQLGIDLDPGKTEQNTGNAFADLQSRRRRHELTFALGPKGETIFRHLSFHPGKFPDKVVPPGEMTLKVTRSGDKGNALYEIAIPWRSLGLDGAMAAGQRIGLAACVCDRDEAKLPLRAIGIFNGIKNGKNADDFGIFTLANP